MVIEIVENGVLDWEVEVEIVEDEVSDWETDVAAQ